jgi:uncharacterized protein
VSRVVRVVTRKWPDRPHWEFDAIALGADAHGHWVGIPRGTWLARPGAGFHATADHVTLVPHEGWYLATVYGTDTERPVDVYVDVATPSTWSEDRSRVVSVDLDLDVVRGVTGRVWVDDEDEFADHRVAWNYPEEVVESAVRSCRELLEAVSAGRAPFDVPHGTAAEWLARLRAVLAES